MYKIYGKPSCPYCVKATDLLYSLGKQFTYIDVSEDAEALAYIKAQGFTTVPQVYLGEDHIGGYTELEQYFK